MCSKHKFHSQCLWNRGDGSGTTGRLKSQLSGILNTKFGHWILVSFYFNSEHFSRILCFPLPCVHYFPLCLVCLCCCVHYPPQLGSPPAPAFRTWLIGTPASHTKSVGSFSQPLWWPQAWAWDHHNIRVWIIIINKKKNLRSYVGTRRETVLQFIQIISFTKQEKV